MKVCTGCNIEKQLRDFYKCKKSENGRRTKCKECIGAYNKKYRNKKNNKKTAKTYQSKYYKENKKKLLGTMKEYRGIDENKEKAKTYHKKYREKNKDRIVGRQRDWSQKQSANNIQFRIKKNIRERIRAVIRRRNTIKPESSIRALGCDVSFLIKRFENKFHCHPRTREMMSWDNYGDWHIDHIIPLASFDLANKGQFLKACHYTNLQPLWAEENLSKGSKII